MSSCFDAFPVFLLLIFVIYCVIISMDHSKVICLKKKVMLSLDNASFSAMGRYCALICFIISPFMCEANTMALTPMEANKI